MFTLGVGMILSGCMGNNPLADRVAPLPPAIAEAPPPAPPSGSLFTGGGRMMLAQDRRASAPGDILTILLVERMQAEKSAAQKGSRSSDRSLTLPEARPFNWLPGGLFNGGAQSDFSGEGSARQANRLSGEISATVTRVLPNGALMIVGDRRIALTRGEEHVQITGIVRPEDIGPDNRVLSTRVADARLRYGGTGEIAAQARQGWLTRFFDRITPF